MMFIKDAIDILEKMYQPDSGFRFRFSEREAAREAVKRLREIQDEEARRTVSADIESIQNEYYGRGREIGYREGIAAASRADAEKDAARFIYDDVCDERLRQDQKWGGDAHDDTHTNSDWMDYIWHQMYRWREEVKSNDPSASPRQRFVKIAALAVAAMASIDRKDAAILAAKEKKS